MTAGPASAPDPDAEIARLRARAQRERAARLEAEHLAETSLRELYLRQEDLRLLERVARGANEAEEPDVVIGRILDDLCAYTGWPVGHAYLLDGDVLRPSGVWHIANPVRHQAFRDATARQVFRAGEGVPGRVLSERGPVWVELLTDGANLPRRAAIAGTDLRSGFAFPVMAGDWILAVLEFYSHALEPPDQRVLDVVAQVAVQVGRALERERSQQQLRRAHAELEVSLDEFARSNEELEAFAYIASHDLQEPLRSVSGFVQLLRRRYAGKLDERGDEYIGYIAEGTERMQTLIDDLLRFSRVGRQAMGRAPVDVGELVATARQALAGAIEEAGAAVDVDALPVVVGDAAMLGQVVTNLVANAVKFHGDAPPVVRVHAQREEHAWRVLVQDNGIGIPAEHVGKVFEMFRRLHSREEFPGTGIGLAICKKIVERHGGTIAVQPAPGGGSCFAFTIPDADAEAGVEADAVAPERDSSVGSPRPG